MLAGDGESVNNNPAQGQYNDPSGWTYGWAWLMRNFDRVVTALEGDGAREDLTPWIVFCPGYDGVVPGWQPPNHVDQFVTMARDRLGPNRALALELSSGYCVWAGDEFNNWSTEAGKCIDTILLEYPWPMLTYDATPAHLPEPPPVVPAHDPENKRRNWDQVWQVTGRLVRPYHRPPEQPSDDDPSPPMLLQGTPRGPQVVVLWEFTTYGHVRGLDPKVTEARRAYLRQLTDNAVVG